MRKNTNVNRDGIIRLIFLVCLIPLLFSSCLSTGPAPSSTGAETRELAGGGASDAEASETGSAPEWMERPPEADEWYVGIAGAPWTGNESEDRTAALAAARAELAAAISVSVEREIEIVEEEKNSGGRSYLNREVRQRLQESVKAGLRDVEVADTWYDRERGYWAYTRLSRRQWEARREGEIADLGRRVEQMLSSMVAANTVPPFSQLRQFAKARELLLQSPWGLLVSGELDGREGLFIDTIDQLVTQHLDTVMIAPLAGPLELFYGESAELELQVSSFISSQPGSVPLLVGLPGGVTRIVSSDQGGTVSLPLASGDLAIGEGEVAVSIDLKQLGFSGELRGLYPDVALSLPLVVKAPEVYISLSYPDGLSGMGLESAVRSLFSERELPISFVDSPGRGGRGALALQVEVRVQDYPKYLEDAPDMASAYMQFSLLRDGRRVYSYESNSEKEGGLTPDQAHERALRSLLSSLKGEAELFSGIETALFAR